MSLLDDLDEGDIYAWGAMLLVGYVLLNYIRDSAATGQGAFPSDAPTYPTIDKAIDILAPMHISPAGQAFIKEQEGWTAQPASDAGGQEVGWGHTIKAGENLAYPLSRSVGESLFQGDIADAEAIVNSTVTAALTQNQFDALGSLAFNSGYSAFKPTSTLLRELNAGNYAGAAQAFALYNKSQGRVSADLVKRRAAEQQRFTG